MDFMMNALENTETPTFGNISQISSIPYQSQLLLKTKSSAFTEASPQASTLSSKSNNSTESKKFLTRVPCVISFGQTLTTDVAGVFPLEALATLLARTSQSNSTIQTTWNSSREPINWSWTGTIGPRKETSSQFSQRLTTATDVETRLQLWK